MMNESASTRRRRSKAVQLLTKIMAAGWFDVQRMASELVVTERTLAQYISGEIDMPLERQLCLAQFLIESVPSLARHGHNLRSQVRSAIQFSGTTTEVHQTAPVPNARSY